MRYCALGSVRGTAGMNMTFFIWIFSSELDVVRVGEMYGFSAYGRIIDAIMFLFDRMHDIFSHVRKKKFNCRKASDDGYVTHRNAKTPYHLETP